MRDLFFFRRLRELILLVLVAGLFAGALALVDQTQGHGLGSSTWHDAVLLFGGGLLIVHFWLALARPRADPLLLPLVAMLCAIGLAVIYRLDQELFWAQFRWIGIGVVIMLLTCTLLSDVYLLARFKYTSALVGVFLLALTAAVGREIYGAKLWLGFGSFIFQTSELMKVLLVVFLAGYLADKKELLSLGDWSLRTHGLRGLRVAYLGPLLVMWLASLAIMVFQRDLGATLLLLGVALAMVYVATSKLSYALFGGLLFLLNLVLTYFLFGYIRARIDGWLHVFDYAQDKGYQVVQGLIAFAAGGVFGQGLGRGEPGIVPVVETDFIFAAIGEELGLLGTFAVLALFLLLVFRGYRISLGQRGDFSLLLAVGLSTILGLQTLVILGGNLQLIPLTGITLPFVSYGGSSILINFLMIGILLRVSAGPGKAKAAG